MKKTILVLLIAVTIGAVIASFGVGEKVDDVNYVDYSLDNEYEYEVVEDKYAVAYEPKGATPKYGLIFYIGTAIPYEHYEYLADALAKEGYVVVLPKVKLGLAYMFYLETEIAFERYPNVKFFVGGHSQGGGAAVRRSMENKEVVAGTILYAPLCYGEDSIKDTSLPTLLLEATKDGVLTKAMKDDAKTRLPLETESIMLEGCHMSFSTMDNDAVLSTFKDGPLGENEKVLQREKTVESTLEFMKEVVTR